MIALHYAGGLFYSTADGGVATILSGWAACCSGKRAETVRRKGNHTYNREAVTCKTCLGLLAKERR